MNRKLTGKILSMIEDSSLQVIGLTMMRLSAGRASEFYAVHKEKSFFDQLISYMTSGECVVAVVEGDDAINRLRALCGNTDPSKAGEGTIRANYGLNITMNSIHASDSPETAREEVGFFFPDLV